MKSFNEQLALMHEKESVDKAIRILSYVRKEFSEEIIEKLQVVQSKIHEEVHGISREALNAMFQELSK